VHLLAAMDHATAAVLAQADVDHTTNEIARFRPLLERLDLTDAVITADALHTQASTPTGWSPTSTPTICCW
jgi:predicted transposase YbfD/YdcC